METNVTFGEWLADCIHAARLDQKDVADAVGTVPSAVSMWLSDENRPRRRVLPALARVLGVDLGDMTERYEAASKGRTGNVSKPKGVKAAQRRTEVHLLAGVPASATQWVDIERQRRMIELPEAWLHDVRSPAMAVTVSGDCLIDRGIFNGDLVICEPVSDTRDVPQGKVVLVRLADEYSLKVWVWKGDDAAELRDGKGVVIATLTDADDYEVLGVARKRYGNVL